MYEEIKYSEAMTQSITAPPQPGQASGNGDYEMTDCPAYAPTNIQNSSTREELDDREYEVINL